MFLMRSASLAVVAAGLLNLTAATPLASAGGARVLTSSSAYMQEAAVFAAYPEKRDDDTAYGCHNPGPEFVGNTFPSRVKINSPLANIYIQTRGQLPPSRTALRLSS